MAPGIEKLVVISTPCIFSKSCHRHNLLHLWLFVVIRGGQTPGSNKMFAQWFWSLSIDDTLFINSFVWFTACIFVSDLHWEDFHNGPTSQPLQQAQIMELQRRLCTNPSFTGTSDPAPGRWGRTSCSGFSPCLSAGASCNNAPILTLLWNLHLAQLCNVAIQLRCLKLLRHWNLHPAFRMLGLR